MACRLIAANAGEDGGVVTAKILENPAYGFGYNAQTGEYGDLHEPRRYRSREGRA